VGGGRRAPAARPYGIRTGAATGYARGVSEVAARQRAPAAAGAGAAVRGGGAATPRARTRPPAWAVVAVAAALLLGAALRLPALGAGLPRTQPDEPTVVNRALAVLDGAEQPSGFDWPLGTSLLLAGAVAVGEEFGLVDRAAPPAVLYLFGRRVFALVALASVAAAGLLGALLAGRGGRPSNRALPAAVAAGAAAAVVAVDVVAVRLSRQVQPDHAQALLVALALAATALAARADRGRVRVAGWVAAGLLAGAAGGMKYLGITAAAVPALAALGDRGLRVPARVAAAGGVALAAAAGFIASTGASVLSRAFVDGFVEQVLHQAGGHLGYDHGGPTWLHHLVVTLPGSLGWPAAVAIVLSVGWGLWRGDRIRRLVAGYAVALFAAIGLSRIEFPHYLLVLLPVLAALAGAAAGDLVRALDRTGVRARARAAAGEGAGRQAPPAVGVALLVALVLVPPAMDAVRVRRAAQAPDTREAVPAALERALAAAGLEGVPVWTESYTGLDAPAVEATGGRQVFAFGDAPDVLACGCVALVSSYMEERPADPAAAAVYAELRSRGDVLLEVRPGVPLTYRWDLLPTWGLGEVPLRGPLPPLGPTVTALDLTAGRSA
jgi:chromate transport protein ChrA